jgi:hypothetical protein
MKNFLQSLNADERSQVLMAILANDPALVKKAYAIAMEIVGDTNVDEISDDVYHALNSLDVDDLYDSSGATRHGYVDPSDRAWEMFEEALYPFIADMKKNQQRSLPFEAKIHCIGIIKGLLKYEKESNSDLSEWVPDAPGESIINVVDEWKEGNPSSDDIAEVMEIVEGINHE